MPTIDELRAAANEHARQLEAVRWISVNDLAVRWGVARATVRKISRELLPYITLGGSDIRRYDPRDVETFEDSKRGAA